MFQADKADRVIGAIKAHPETHNQAAWRCETGMCFAGWYAELEGAQWAFNVDFIPGASLVVSDQGTPLGNFVNNKWGLESMVPGVTEDTLVECVSTYAARGLGLTEYQASVMFSANNSVEDLENGVKILANGQDLDTFLR